MITAPLKMFLLALLLLIPSGNARSADDPPNEKRIIIDEDAFTFDGDTPLVLHLGQNSGREYIGVRLIEITPELRVHYGAPRDAGVLVAEVEPESPAAKAGILVGDVITSVDGERMDSPWGLSRAIRRKKGGDTLRMEAFRDRAARHLTVTVAERKRPQIDFGERRHGLHGHRWIIPDLDSRKGFFEGWTDDRRLQDRIEELEKRVKELESKRPAR